MLKKVYDEQIFGAEGEREYWRMVASERKIDDSFLTGFTASDIDFDGIDMESTPSSSDDDLRETTRESVVPDLDVWGGKLLVLGYAQLRLLDTHCCCIWRCCLGYLTVMESQGDSLRRPF